MIYLIGKVPCASKDHLKEENILNKRLSKNIVGEATKAYPYRMILQIMDAHQNNYVEIPKCVIQTMTS